MLGAGIFSSKCAKAILTTTSPSKGKRPVSISYILIPREYISLLLSHFSPFACSGDI